MAKFISATSPSNFLIGTDHITHIIIKEGTVAEIYFTNNSGEGASVLCDVNSASFQSFLAKDVI